MAQRGRKSLADLSAVRFPDARVMAPESLTAAQAAEWRAIVDSLPADFFRPGDVPLLAAFCIASALHKQAAAALELDGITLTNARGTEVAHPACSILSSQASAMATLSVRLRLCPSARMLQSKADKQAGDAPKGKRPWNDESESQAS